MSYNLDTDFQYVCTVTVTLKIWPFVMVIAQPWVMDNNCVKHYPEPTWQWGDMARTLIFYMCALRPWPWRYDLGSRLWHTPGSWTTIMWNMIQFQLSSEKVPDTDFQYVCTVTLTLKMSLDQVITLPGVMDNNCVKYYSDPTLQWGVMARTWNLVCVHYNLDLWGMALGQGHDTPFGYWQQLCEILSRFNFAVRSYGPDTDFGYVCTVTSTLEIWPWVKVMTESFPFLIV